MILLLCGNPTNRRALVDMASLMTKRYGILFLAHIAQGPVTYKTKEEITLSQKAWLRSKNIKAFYKLMESNSLSDGIKSLMQASGIGKFTPNIVMLGFKTNWQTCDLNNLLDYYEIIQ
jgi:solute carrier family 12 sodium/potassium/chloride transporter 2